MTPVSHPNASAARHRYAVFVACCTFLLVIAGGLVTSTGSGLAVPDWPLSFGQVFPRMEGGVLFEHGHRMVAAAVGFLTIILAVWTSRAESRAWVRKLGWTMLAVVILQGLLGGLTVLTRLPDPVSISHAGLAQIFFSLTVIMAAVTSLRWFSVLGPRSSVFGLQRMAAAAVAVVYAQILLGAIVRHTGAGLVIPDFPLSNGRLVPEFANMLVVWQFAHRAFAILVAGHVIATAAKALKTGESWLRVPALSLIGLILLQIGLGAFTIWSGRAVIPTTAHVATGALILVTTVLLALRARRLNGNPAPVPAGEPAMATAA